MKRVMIIGQPGSGKSTLARALGEITGLPVVHVDLIHWMPGWEERPKPEKIEMALAEEAKPEWIFEGGLSATWDNRLARADTLIVLDMPFLLRVWRVFKRTIRDYGRSRADLPEDCPEQFDPEFWAWIWNTRNTARARIRAMATAALETKDVYHLRSPADVRGFLHELETVYA
ncbi:DNA topology modulation protein [Candidatus Rhodobacter oscarellae]|uniref:DNA topology modulation protein n=1 Tax=Candidatus Rhodobacter oscarellae TaxID=1675527 RepID=A0A0J9E823_9RHOB|nr:ATPase AAA [Candidatus Rhodobacter lobularis]KMW58877.1 DNA topology modulation protein [Candidatus Rhodobacter lobularis]